ncbi:MAG TPA: thioredoxin family protein [Chthoniobacterales bacterium]
MKNLRLLVAAASLLAISCSQSSTAEESTKTSASAKNGWLTNYAEAQQEAKSQHKLLLMDFTGSDWCGWCVRLEKEVFSQPEFKDYASKNLVLLELDFPRRKELSAEMMEQNQRLAMKYQIQGFPTIVVLDSSGKEIAQLGYVRGGPAAFIAELEKLPKG